MMGQGKDIREVRGQEKFLLPSEFFWSYFLPHSIPIFLPSPTPPAHSRGSSECAVTGSDATPPPLDVNEPALSSSHPGGQRLLSVSPASLSGDSSPPPQAQLRP